MILIGSMWLLLAIARCVLHQSFALPPETDASTLALVNLVFGGYFGTWLVLCQKLSFSAEGAATRLAWGCIVVGGIWGLTPDSQEIVQVAEINFERFAGSRGSAGGLKGTSIWLLGVGVALSLWLVHPLFRSLTIHSAPSEATTAPIIQEPAESLGLVRHLWLLRIAVVVGCSYWLKSNINVRSQPSEAFSYWLILLVATSLGASLATFPYYLAIIMRRRWLGFIFFNAVWVGVPCVLIALTYTLQTSWPVLPKAVVDSLASIIAPFLVGFSLTMLVSFWSSCFFRDRAILTMPAAVVERINEKKSPNGPTVDSGRSSQMSAVWPRIFLVAVAAISLFGAIHWGGLLLQRQIHLGTWWMTDVNHWGRATALARLQHLQDSDPDVARKFQRRHWQYDQPLQTTLDGTVHCVVSAKMANSPAWKLLREDVEFSFKDVLWTMDFPVSDPADISGSAYSVLKIDGEGLRLRDLPTAVYPMSWEVFGGSIEDSDYVRGSACYGLSFERCKFVDVDFQRPLLARHQSLHFTDCTFSELPRVFPEEVQAIFTLSRPEEFLENHEQFIEAIFNGCQVILVPPNPKTIDGDQFLLQIPKHWRHLIRISRMPNSERVRVQQTPILSLYTSANELPANLNTRILETNDVGQVVGLDFRQWQWHRLESPRETND